MSDADWYIQQTRDGVWAVFLSGNPVQEFSTSPWGLLRAKLWGLWNDKGWLPIAGS